MEKYVPQILKALAIVLVGYLVMMIGNGLGSLAVSIIGGHMVGLVGAVLAGIAAGCLTAFMYRRNVPYLAPILAALPVLFSWFGRHARSTRVTYVYKNGTLIPTGSPHPQPVYSVLIMLLAVAMVVSVIAYLISRRIANKASARP
ncbi:MAG: hypothetical protein KBC96_00400 [Armatimonadetes bacterium]|nr:hypothetical protein [Armatimonadota bacterium]